MNFHGLTDETVDEIKKVLARFPQVEQAVLYGSRAKGNFKTGSDVDLTLIGVDLTPKILLGIQSEFSDGSLPYRFDISIFSQLTSQELIEHIRRVGKVFYER